MKMAVILSLLLTCSLNVLLAQPANDHEKNIQPFLRNGWRVSVKPSIAKKAKVTPNETYRPGASNFISLGAGIDYVCHFSPQWSLATGLHGLWLGSNFTFFVPRESFQPPISFDLEQKGPTSGGLEHGIISLQSTLEKRWFAPGGTIWNTGLGAAVNYSPTTGYQVGYMVYDNGRQMDYATLYHDTYSERKSFLSLHGMIGRYWKFGKRTLFLTNVVVSYSFSNFIEGMYVFSIPGRPEVSGRYAIDGTHIGLDISYILPSKKARLLQ